MLLELQDTNGENINKLMAFARQNHLPLTLIDDADNNWHLPGKPLTPEELSRLIDGSRKSGVIKMKDAHEMIRNNTHAD